MSKGLRRSAFNEYDNPSSFAAERTVILIGWFNIWLLFSDSAVVVHKSESVFVLRIALALDALVARTEIARWIIYRNWIPGTSLFLAS